MAEALDLNPVTTSKVTLNSGNEMPAVGLGACRVRNTDFVTTVIDQALAAGYRMFDTVSAYHNETSFGEAFRTLLPKHDLTRDDIFVTAKLYPADGSYDSVYRAYQQSMDHLGLGFADLYLLNCPCIPKIPADDPRNIQLRDASWASLVKLYDSGLVNDIGVSNYTVKHLQQMLQINHSVIPVVNQVEWHPFNYDVGLLEYCKSQGIAVQACTSLAGKSVDNDEVITHPGVTKVARKLGVSNARVLLAWALQQDVAVIPRSADPVHIQENIKLNFTISNEGMRILNDLGSYKLKYAWDPSGIV